ncbi:uncharacterized protein LOC130673015 [Microplitis mediator]|uniref:uncharacterized protein LOC130673015 n=1 Tax=Microplitis mediator TaxID=375433 RepID=UPI00255684AA|nr:uncharacterized protein LOC130673015 [Microplitis mediator]
MAQSLINVIKIYLPIIISGNVLISACSSKSVSNPPPARIHLIDPDHPVSDVIRLHNAITDNDRSEIVDLFINKHLGNRKRLLKDYLNAYAINLTDHCRSKLSGDFGYLIESLAKPPQLFIVNELYDVFFDLLGRHYNTLVEIFGYHDLESIKRAYRLTYGVEMIEHFKNLPFFIRERFEDIIDETSYGTHHTIDGELRASQPEYFSDMLVESAREPNIRRFTRIIVLSLNDDILDELKTSYRVIYKEPLENLVEQCPDKDYSKAVLAILKFPGVYGNNMLRSN